jgi:drug/metabolite transporter (DMT)-like permease
MTHPEWLWMVFTVLAAAAQVARNAMQRELTGTLGTVGATHVRFLFGFPFAVLFLVVLLTVTGESFPHISAGFWPWVLLGALTQIAATALMLAAMGERSFVVATAYIKTEPVQVALFGLIFLGDRISLPVAAAILIATTGVVAMSWKPNRGAEGGAKPMVLGLTAGAFFALSAIGYRGAILTVNAEFVMAATSTLAIGLAVQAALLSLYLAVRQRGVLVAIARAWRPSLFAGMMGAVASQFWFLSFALTSAANVRTLALVEVLFAQGISHFIFKQPVTARDMLGIALIIAGVLLLIWAH